MLLDWFTIAAQAVNFLILVVLLKHFLYGRILRAIDQREANFQAREDEQSARERSMQAEVEDYQKRIKQLEAQRTEILAQARTEAAEKREQLLQEIREELSLMRDEWSASLNREQKEFLSALRKRSAEETIAMARSLLMELAGIDLETRMVEVLQTKIQQLPAADLENLAQALQSDSPVILRSAFPLSPKASTSLATSLQQLLPKEEGKLELQCEEEDELICGIELEVDGHKLGWSFDDRLGHIEEILAEAIDEEIRKTESHERRSA